MTRRGTRHRLLVGAVVFCVAACSNTSPETSTASVQPATSEPAVVEPSPTPVPERASATDGPATCEDTFDETVSLLRRGLPTYDFEPARDLMELVAWSDVVVTGTIETMHRPAPDAGTTIEVSNTDVVSPVGSSAEVTAFWLDTFWPGGVGPDPLATAQPANGARFLAFLHAADRIPTGLAVGVQGLYVDCPTAPELHRNIIEVLPADAADLEVDETVARIHDAHRRCGQEVQLETPADAGDTFADPRAALEAFLEPWAAAYQGRVDTLAVHGRVWADDLVIVRARANGIGDAWAIAEATACEAYPAPE